MRIPDEIIQRIKDAAKIEDFIPDLKKNGAGLKTKCPECHKEGGLKVTTGKQLAKCFHCDWSAANAWDYLIKADGLSYPEAMEQIAQYYSIPIESEAERKKRLKREHKKKQKSFLQKQLEESGLTLQDITAKVYEDDDNKTTREVQVFQSGTRDQYGRYKKGRADDDMLIYYYDLEGRPVTYKKEKTSRFEQLIRVRWQNPEAHRDKENRPIKYQSPSGSGSHLYIPENIRTKYRHKKKIARLFIQEGEKKAEKACKHGIPSVGIMGIQNLGYNNQLPPDLQIIIQTCEVEEVVFMLDADWDQLSSELKNGDNIERRPKNFFYAVKNYREYMRTLVNIGLSVEIYFGYVQENAKNDKGVDDLLANTLKTKEDTLANDIDHAIHEKDGAGQYVQVYKITMMNDKQLADLWLLNDTEKFCQAHKEEIKHLAEFKFGKIAWRYDEDKLLMAQPILPSEQYWEETFIETKNGDRKQLNFDYANCFLFLQNRGFHRIRMKSGSWDFVHVEKNKVIKKVDQYEIRDYVTEFTKELKGRKDVLNMLYRGGTQYLGYEKLSNLEYVHPVFERADKGSQNLYFKDKFWKITAEGIKEFNYTQMERHVWQDKIIDFEAHMLKEPMIKIKRISPEMKQKKEYANLPKGEFIIQVSQDAQKCDFLRFLSNASKFYWRKRMLHSKDPVKYDDIEPEEEFEETRHLVNKLTSIGYLLHDYKNDSELKAVIAMDGKLSEVGASNGRSGKSLFGRAIEYVIPQVYIAAKNKKLTEDQFLFGEVTEKIKNVFLDDVRANVDFEFFFPLITGKLKVNVKGGAQFTLEGEDTPKLLITTNHAISGEGSSFKDRQAFVAFSDYYNDEHKPIDDFGRNFFSEWDQQQWNLYYNLAANCLMLYFQSISEGWAGSAKGIVDPPMETLEMRRLRQQIGEDLLTWAEEYFSENDVEVDRGNINQRRIRKDMFDDFISKNTHAARYVTASSFGKKIKFYCKYKGYHFNPNKLNKDGTEFAAWQRHYPGESFFGEPDKSGGVEYFTIADNNYRPTDEEPF